MRPKMLTIMMLACVCALTLTGCPGKVLRFTSADVLGDFRNVGVDTAQGAAYRTDDTTMENDMLLPALAAEGNSATTTTREIVEPDIVVKKDGYLYVLNQYRGLVIVDMAQQTVVGEAPTFGFPRDLYIANGRAYVLVSSAYDTKSKGNTIKVNISSKLYCLDVQNPASPVVQSSFRLNGELLDSRMVGDILYAVCAQFQWSWYGPMPMAVSSQAEDVAVRPAVLKSQTSGSWVTSINCANPDAPTPVDEVSFASMGNVIHATTDAILVAGNQTETLANGVQGSRITYVDIRSAEGNIAVRGTMDVPGYVGDRYKMDVYDNVLRVVSQDWNNGLKVWVSTFSLTNPEVPQQLAAVPLDQAAGETLFATRFDGPRGYIVTYLQKDPLFVLDLSNPAAPVIAGHIEVPGWSTHIEPRGNRLIALGVDDTNGQKVSVQLFDVENPATPIQLNRVTFGEGWSWSSAYGDVKAFSVLEDTIVVPVSMWDQANGYVERLQFISYNGQRLDPRGSVDIEGAAQRTLRNDTQYVGLSPEQLVFVDGANLDQPVVTRRVALAEPVHDFYEIAPETGAAVITTPYSEDITVRVVSIRSGRTLGPAISEVKLDQLGSFTDSVVYGSKVAVICIGYENGKSFYNVAIVDCSNVSELRVTKLRVDRTPLHGYYVPMTTNSYGDGGIATMTNVGSPDIALKAETGASEPGSTGSSGATDSAEPSAPSSDASSISSYSPYYYWFPQWRKSTVLHGASLLLPILIDGGSYDQKFGAGDPEQGFTVINLAEETRTLDIALGDDNIVDLDDYSGRLYVTFQETVSGNRCAYHVRELDLVSFEEKAAVNVPGRPIMFVPESSTLVLRDEQWQTDGTAQSEFNAIRWNADGEAEVVDTLSIPGYAVETIARDGRMYLTTYDEDGLWLFGARLTDSDKFALSSGHVVARTWGSLLDAAGTSVYFSIGGAVARYSFADGEPALAEIAPVMSYPTKVRFGATSAYVVLGRSGAITMAR